MLVEGENESYAETTCIIEKLLSVYKRLAG